MRTRTQLTQAMFSLDGATPVPVTLPHTWNALDGQDGGNDYHRGIGAYQISLPAPTAGKRQYLQINGANHIATAWCNGKLLGTHRGGFSTFRFELTQALQAGENTVQLQVDNRVCQVYPQRADFTFYGGLYRDVAFLEVDNAHFDLMKDGSEGVFVTPQVNGETRVDLFCVEAEAHRVSLRILDTEGKTVAQQTGEAGPHIHMQLKVDEPRLWQGTEDPYCYRLEATLLRGEEPVDQVITEFGYCAFRTDPDTGFWLNGRQLPLHGVSRHQDRRDKGWAISKEDHREDAALIAEIGANTVRLAHYQHDPYFYSLCDRMGFVVWAEIPFISQFMEGQDARENTLSQMKELIAQCYNHPSICFWGISNEITIGGYSQPLLENLRELNKLCKQLDPSRQTTMAQLRSVPADSEHVQITDVQGYNYYMGWYSDTVEMNGPCMDKWHETNPDRVYGISEYGADHYPCWHSANPFNHDYTEEYALYYHQEMLKTFAARPYLWATYVWNMFDFAADARKEGGFQGINAKGLITYDRKLKKDTFYLYQAWWSKKPMVHICGRRFLERAPGERAVTVVTNAPSVTLELNGKPLGAQNTVEHMVVFADVPLEPGENKVVAKTAFGEDAIVLVGAQAHNTDYDVPDIQSALQAGNWFSAQTEEGELANIYTAATPCGELLTEPECLQRIKGWLMTDQDLSMGEKMTLITRLHAFSGSRATTPFRELKTVQKLVSEEKLDQLDQILRRVKGKEA